MLETIPGLSVAGETSSHADLSALVSGIRPDILFIDVHLRNGNCFDLTARLHHLFPEIRIILMSMFAEQGYMDDGLQAGASAVIFKPSFGDSIEELLCKLFPEEFQTGVIFFSGTTKNR